MLLIMNTLDDNRRKLKQCLEKMNRDPTKAKKTFRDKLPHDFQNTLSTVNTCFLNLAMVVKESEFLSGREYSDVQKLEEMLPVWESRLASCKDDEELKSIVQEIVISTGDIDVNKMRWTENYAYEYDFRTQFVSGEYIKPVAQPDDEALEIICDAIDVGHRHVNVFDMTVRKGQFPTKFKNGRENIDLYGMNVEENVDCSEREAFKRLIYGGFKGSMISNNIFDIIFCYPLISISKVVSGHSGVIVKKERDMLQKSSDYLKTGGLFVFALPYFRFHKEICLYLAANYYDVQLFATSAAMNSREKPVRYIYFIGRKKETTKNLPDDKIYHILRNLPLHWQDTVQMNPVLKPYRIEEGVFVIPKFRGSKLSEYEVAQLYNNSRCTKEFRQSQIVEKLGENPARPLLPFSVGQLGLILTSGCMDGIINEGDGYFHAVKGRIVKHSDFSETTEDNGSVQTVNTVSNRVEINALLPDGTLKCLA